MSQVKPYPLAWPPQQPRTRERTFSRFGKHTRASARRALLEELERFGARGIVVSTMVRVRQDGGFVSSAARPDDPGVAVYFSHPLLRLAVLACDHYVTLECNLWALVHTVRALRSIERHGGAEILSTTMSGYAALPPAPPQWESTLGSCQSIEEVRRRYAQLALTKHPDHGGNDEEWMKIRVAYEAALRYFRAPE